MELRSILSEAGLTAAAWKGVSGPEGFLSKLHPGVSLCLLTSFLNHLSCFSLTVVGFEIFALTHILARVTIFVL